MMIIQQSLSLNHKNSQKRIISPDFTYFVTTNTKDRYPYFENELLCDLFIEELKIVKEIKKFLLFGFCIMPDHIHLLIRPDVNVANLSQIMFSIKKQFSHDANRILGYNEKYSKLMINENNRLNYKNDRPYYEGAQTFARLHNMINNENNLSNLHVPPFKWHKSYHDHYIRNHMDFKNHLRYINNNHLKHDLPVNWKYIGYNFPNMLDL